jgi:hypothetical protein
METSDTYFQDSRAGARARQAFTVWSQYHLRERVDPTVDSQVECLTLPLTQVVLTSFRCVAFPNGRACGHCPFISLLEG